MRVRLGRWNPGDPPSLTIEAETLDDTQILRAIADGSNTHRIALGSGYNCSPPAHGELPGTVEVSLSWFKKDITGCTVCGALVHGPCETIQKSASCDLPPGTVFVVDFGRDRPVRVVGRRVMGITEITREISEPSHTTDLLDPTNHPD